MLEIAKFCSMDTLELCGDLLQPGGQLETPGLVQITLIEFTAKTQPPVVKSNWKTIIITLLKFWARLPTLYFTRCFLVYFDFKYFQLACHCLN